MPSAIRQLGALLADTVRGTLRRPVIGLLLLVAMLLSGALPTVDLLSFLGRRALVADAQVALLLLAGILAAGLAVAGGLGDELRHGAPELLCRTVSPVMLAWSRWLGLAAALTILWLPLAAAVVWGSRTAFDDYQDDVLAARLYFGTLGLGMMLAAGSSWLGRGAFAAALSGWLAGLMPLGVALLTFLPRGELPGGHLIDWELCPSILLLLPAIWLGAAAAMFAGLWLDGSAVLVATMALFVLGLAGPPLLAEAGVGWLAALLPSWQPFWLEPGASPAWAAVAAGGLQTAALVMLTAAGVAKRSGR